MYLPKGQNHPAVYGKVLVCKARADKRQVVPDELTEGRRIAGAAEIVDLMTGEETKVITFSQISFGQCRQVGTGGIIPLLVKKCELVYTFSGRKKYQFVNI
jgi:hypothetical protein